MANIGILSEITAFGMYIFAWYSSINNLVYQYAYIHSPLLRRGRGRGCLSGCGRTGYRGHRPTMVCKANLSRIGASVPHPPAISKAYHSPLQRGGESRASRGAGVGLLGFGLAFYFILSTNLNNLFHLMPEKP